MKFLNDFAIALLKPKKYSQILDAKKGFTFTYVCILILLSISLYISAFITLYNNLGTYYKEVVPDFTFENNNLTMAEPFRLELMGQIIAADSEKDFSAADLGENSQGILLDKNSMILRSMGRDIEVHYSDLTGGENISFSKQDTYLLETKIKSTYVIFVAFISMFLVAGFFIGALLVAFISKAANISAGLKFGQLYKLAIFSRGLPVILSFVLSFFLAPLPFLVSFLISCIIMNVALGAISKNKLM